MRRHSFDRVGWLVALMLTAFALIATAGAASAQSRGNNGTVKIHDGATDSQPIVRNEPHVTTFHLHFFFADPAQSGSWEIRVWAPGDKGMLVLSGPYDTAPDGSDRRPATGEYALPCGHYKLFWSGRNDHNIKHKTFWVDEETATSSPSPRDEPATGGMPIESAQPTGEELGISGTLPPTSTSETPAPASSVNLGPVFAVVAFSAGLAVLLTPAGPRLGRRS